MLWRWTSYNNVKHKRLLLQAQKSVYFERMFCCTFDEQLEGDYYLWAVIEKQDH